MEKKTMRTNELVLIFFLQCIRRLQILSMIDTKKNQDKTRQESIFRLQAGRSPEQPRGFIASAAQTPMSSVKRGGLRFVIGLFCFCLGFRCFCVFFVVCDQRRTQISCFLLLFCCFSMLYLSNGGLRFVVLFLLHCCFVVFCCCL